MLELLVRKYRILLQLEQIALLICTSDIKEIFYNKKGTHTIRHIPFNTQEAFLEKTVEEKKNFGKELFQKLSGKNPEEIIFLEEKYENGNLVLYGIPKHPVSYAQKILGRQFLQDFSSLLKQDKFNKEEIHQEIISACTKIGQMVLENVDLNILFNEINNKIKEITFARNAGFFLYNEKNNCLILQEPAFSIPKSKEVITYSVSLTEDNIIVNVFKDRRALYKNEVSRESLPLGSLTSFFKIDNFLVIPLIIGNRCIGVYCLLNRPGGFYKEMEILLCQMMSQIAVLIESAQQLKQLQTHAIEMRRICEQEKENSNRYKYLMYAHQKLTAILIQEPGIEVIVNRVAQHFKMPVVLFDHLHWNYIISEIGREKINAEQLHFLTEYFKRLSHNPEMCSTKPSRQTFFLNGSEETVVMAALKVKDDIMGFIVLFEDLIKLNQLQMLVLEQTTVNMCTLEFLKQKMAFEVEQNLKDSFLDALINWDENKEMNIVNMAANCGYNFSYPYLVAVLAFNDVSDIKETQLLLLKKKSILRALNEILKKNVPGGMVFCKRDHLIVLIPCTDEIDEVGTSSGYKKAHLFFSHIQRSIFDTTEISVSIGIGSIVKELRNVKQSYYEARYAVDFLQMTRQQEIVLFDELGFYQLFADQKEKKRLEEIAKNQLKELIKSDCSKGTSFLKTLERYFYHDGNLRATSNDLHIHINTLRYRLKVLKDTFNIDLASEKCKFNTYFAVKTLSFLCPKLFI